jgi:replicative DNA helicase
MDTNVRLVGGPSNVDAEKFVLGSILANNGLYLHAAGGLACEDFSLEKHRRIFERMGSLHDRGETIDYVTVANELTKFGQLEACDGVSYLIGLNDGLPHLTNIDSYIHIVKDKSLLRRIIRISQHLIDRCLANAETPGEILAATEKIMAELGETRTTTLSWIASDLLRGVLEMAWKRAELRRETGKAVLGIESGIRRVDDLLNGFCPGLHLLAGGPGLGKTSLCMQIAVNACQQSVPVVYVTYENGRLNLILKAICARAGLSPRDVERGALGDEQRKKLGVAASELEIPLSHLEIIEGTMNLKIAEIRAKVVNVLSRCRARTCLVIFDYLQRAAHAQGYQELRNNVSALAGHLCDLAKRTDCPVLAISSQNRAEGNYGNGRGSSSLTSLKESGDLEYSADSVMFLHQSEQRTAVLPAVAVDLTIAKNRFGPTGSTALIFRANIGDFREEARG